MRPQRGHDKPDGQDEPRGHVRRPVHVQPLGHDELPGHDELLSHDKPRLLPVAFHPPRLVHEMRQQDGRAA